MNVIEVRKKDDADRRAGLQQLLGGLGEQLYMITRDPKLIDSLPYLSGGIGRITLAPATLGIPPLNGVPFAVAAAPAITTQALNLLAPTPLLAPAAPAPAPATIGGMDR